MGAHLITGYAGKEHITSADQGAFHAGIVGAGKYVLKTAKEFAAEVVTNNLIKIHAGDLLNQGRHMNIAVNDYAECEIDNGLQGLKRNDLIVMRYSRNKDTDIERAEVLVLKGASGETATDPEYLTGDILKGDTEDDFLLYRVSLDGISIESVTPLFESLPSIRVCYDELTAHRTVLASTTRSGHVQLENSVNSTSTSKAAVPASVKAAYDRATDAETLAKTVRNRADDAYSLAKSAEATADAAVPKEKISRGNAVTSAGTYVLDARENNPSVEGTLANTVKKVKDTADYAAEKLINTIVKGSPVTTSVTVAAGASKDCSPMIPIRTGYVLLDVQWQIGGTGYTNIVTIPRGNGMIGLKNTGSSSAALSVVATPVWVKSSIT